jgi:hypothetical protein
MEAHAWRVVLWGERNNFLLSPALTTSFRFKVTLEDYHNTTHDRAAQPRDQSTPQKDGGEALRDSLAHPWSRCSVTT